MKSRRKHTLKSAFWYRTPHGLERQRARRPVLRIGAGAWLSLQAFPPPCPSVPVKDTDTRGLWFSPPRASRTVTGPFLGFCFLRGDSQGVFGVVSASVLGAPSACRRRSATTASSCACQARTPVTCELC